MSHVYSVVSIEPKSMTLDHIEGIFQDASHGSEVPDIWPAGPALARPGIIWPDVKILAAVKLSNFPAHFQRVN